MDPQKSKLLILSGLFIALGILIPSVFHAVGAGAVLLPMFWPIAVACFYLPVPMAVLIGAGTPLISFMVTGMPPVSPPVLQIMIPELMVFSFTTSFFYRKLKSPPVISLLSGIIISRFVVAGLSWIAALIFNLPGYIFSIGTVIHSIPGSLIIIFVIPVVIRIIDSSKTINTE